MMNGKSFTTSPKELTQPLVGPITVTLYDPILQDLNTYRQIRYFYTEYPYGTPAFSLEFLRQKQQDAIQGMALFLMGLVESAAAAEQIFEGARNGAPELVIGAGQQAWHKFDDVQAPASFLPELIRMRADIQRSPNMIDADAILAQAYGLTKGLELLGGDKTIALALFHRMQFHHARRRSDLLSEDRPQA